jgi:hypothetical protein
LGVFGDIVKVLYIAAFMTRLNRVLFVLFLTFSVLFILPTSAKAVVTNCTVNVSPTTTTRDTSTVYTFDGTVDTSEPGEGIMWVQFTRPSANFTITNGTASGWSDSTDGTTITFTAPAQTFLGTFEVYATSGSSDASAENWSVQMSHSGSGTSPSSCSGSLGVSISGSSSVTPTQTPTNTPVPDTTAPTISNVTISGVSDSSVTISWNTSENATSNVNYGTTTGYGSGKTGSGYTTSHSLVISGLTVNTTYHGQIQSTDGPGNTASSSDFTFATSQSTTTVTVTTTTTTTTIVTPTPTPTPTPDLAPPKVTISTTLDKVFASSPLIEGKATDNVSVRTLEYSVDNGQHWSSIDNFSKPGEKNTTFSFTPVLQGDGNYALKIRAADDNNNKVETPAQTIIIDRLPPAIGGALFSIGPQILQPDPNGSLVTLAGLYPKLTFAAVGGPISIDAKLSNNSTQFYQNAHTRLWSGQLPLNEPGTFTIETISTDGAKNQTTKSLGYITVLPNGTISDTLGPISNAVITAFYFDSQTKSFRIWSAEQYGQENPQSTDELGRYRFLLPTGTYYLQIESAFSRPTRTNIFTLTQPTPIYQNFTLVERNRVPFGSFAVPLPDFGQHDVMIQIPIQQTSELESQSLVGQPFPEFSLDSISNSTFAGKPAVISVLTTWLPQSSAQIHILEEITQQQELQTVVIMSQESPASVNVFAKRGNYLTPVIADPDGVLVTPLQVRTLPTHYFIDRKGTIQKVISGILTKEQIVSHVSQLQ